MAGIALGHIPVSLGSGHITLDFYPLPATQSSLTMYDLPLTGAQRTYLRGLGQTLTPALKLGKGGLTPAFFIELQKQLRAHELIKLRFLTADRVERAAFCTQIAVEGRCLCVGAVGHTALFYRQHPEPAGRSVTLP